MSSSDNKSIVEDLVLQIANMVLTEERIKLLKDEKYAKIYKYGKYL